MNKENVCDDYEFCGNTENIECLEYNMHKQYLCPECMAIEQDNIREDIAQCETDNWLRAAR
jgi:ribosomal protein L37AE/L43A